MAIYFDFYKRFRTQLKCDPKQAGYYILPIHNFNYQDSDLIQDWIEQNVVSDWTFWDFSIAPEGRTYCFKDQTDAIAFKLRFCNE